MLMLNIIVFARIYFYIILEIFTFYIDLIGSLFLFRRYIPNKYCIYMYSNIIMIIIITIVELFMKYNIIILNLFRLTYRINFAN